MNGKIDTNAVETIELTWDIGICHAKTLHTNYFFLIVPRFGITGK